MDDFTRKFITEWRKLLLPFENETFVIAVSGGADSCALAEVLKELKNKKKLNHHFVVAHFDHQLRDEESAHDAIWVSRFAEKLGFELVGGVAIAGEINKKSNVEQSARDARYRFLFQTSERVNAYAILLGHTKNDQAETLLLNLIRGSGIKGLSGMSVINELGPDTNGKHSQLESSTYRLIRPMMSWAERRDIEKFVEKQKIDFRQDSMNENLDLKRVRIRKELIPVLQRYNPDIIETLARTAQVLGEDNSLLEKFDRSKNGKADIKRDRLKLKELTGLSGVELKRLIRSWLSHHRGGLRRLEHMHIENIASLVHSKKSGRKIELPGGEMVVKQKGELFFRQMKVEK